MKSDPFYRIKQWWNTGKLGGYVIKKLWPTGKKVPVVQDLPPNEVIHVGPYSYRGHIFKMHNNEPICYIIQADYTEIGPTIKLELIETYRQFIALLELEETNRD